MNPRKHRRLFNLEQVDRVVNLLAGGSYAVACIDPFSLFQESSRSGRLDALAEC